MKKDESDANAKDNVSKEIAFKFLGAGAASFAIQFGDCRFVGTELPGGTFVLFFGGGAVPTNGAIFNAVSFAVFSTVNSTINVT
jgi:hypothetical protein